MRRRRSLFDLSLSPTPAAWLVACVLVSGCQPQPSSDEQLTPRAARVVYYSWSGTSPGGGFTFTSLSATEVNFDAGRTRGFHATAGAPDPMLPHARDEILEMLADRPWEDLAPEQTERLVRLVHDWLASDPPETYNIPRGGLGREDGHAEVMMVTMDSGQQHTTSVNPRGGFSPSDPLAPSPQWGQLVKELIRLRGINPDFLPLGVRSSSATRRSVPPSAGPSGQGDDSATISVAPVGT